MPIPSTSCSLCGYAHVVVRLRPLWMTLLNGRPMTNDPGLALSRGFGEYDLCADCRNRVLDTLQPVKEAAR